MTEESRTRPTTDVPEVVARPLHISWWLSGTIVAALALLFIRSLYHNPNLEWSVVGEFITNFRILQGLWVTMELAVLSQIIAIVLGLVVALLYMSRNPVSKTVGWGYIWFFRGTPLLVHILFWGNFALFYGHLALAIPFTDIVFASWDTNAVISVFVASVLGLSLHEAGYMAEIIRTGLISVDKGQVEAAQALGLTRRQLMARVVLPQALRVIVPPTGNQFINMIKMTSLVAVIAGGDMLTVALNISAVNLRTIEMLIVATFWYLFVTSIASAGQALLERRLGRGVQ